MVKGVQHNMPQAAQGVGAHEKSSNASPAAGKGFDAVLQKTIEARNLSFSRHAVDRMASRNIRVSAEELSKMNGAIDRAAEKGAKESLLVLEQNAFIVSVENRTVITAVDRENMKNNMFTNIDSAVLL
jgi:flagellar operon protein